jgi:hypothetical protein
MMDLKELTLYLLIRLRENKIKFLGHPHNFESLIKLTNYAIIFSIAVSISIIADNTIFEFVSLPPES